ncbi:class I SAM-dependent methyltransferase [Candidatus Bathyarchaeota archaeon]|nr:class I SAM-dependent methyltransferase [Candidatus Bathyarchaeota archaeon]
MVKNELFERYSKTCFQFYDEDVPRLLESVLIGLGKRGQKFRMLDIGCGDGKFIFALHKRKFLENAEEIVGVDASQDRIDRLRTNLPFAKGIAADASNLKQPDASFDLVICTQVIEHVENARALVTEIRRLLKHEGFAYVTSVVKKRWGVYVYFRDGSVRLDPTHVREYSSKEEFVDSFSREGFVTVSLTTNHVAYSVTDLLIRLLVRIGLRNPDSRYYLKRQNMSRLRPLRLPVPGYETVEVLLKKP